MALLVAATLTACESGHAPNEAQRHAYIWARQHVGEDAQVSCVHWRDVSRCTVSAAWVRPVTLECFNFGCELRLERSDS